MKHHTGRAFHFAGLLVVVVALTACASMTDGGRDASNANEDAGTSQHDALSAGHDASNGAGNTLNDGTLGSTCTSSCQSGLTCDTQVSGGYCTRACTSSADCAGGFCYQVGSGGACLRACGAGGACPNGNVCYGQAGSQVCVPPQIVPDGGMMMGSGVCGATFDVAANWGRCGSSGCEEVRLRADGSANYLYWNASSGNTESAGTWAATCPTITVQLTAGYYAGSTYRWSVGSDGLYQGSERWGRCNPTCI